METTYFILGVLSIVSLIAIGGVVKMFSSVSQLRERVGELQRSLDNEVRGTQLEFKDGIRDIETAITEANRRIDEVDRELNRYIDSRYDKLLDIVNKLQLHAFSANVKKEV